ncbi:auxin-responsive protein SAUR68-like [Pistacia vera]|uniref:auxin-responsive protein SAUR68-like n=1 Tax=Pistacia vera TaxID=55513 RepID=UPI001263306E|nr:auxin-responsive protein SAUR68-like [Pistacia vera]KAJ0077506.1 hypothetical protein Patl1_35803 [Pistacia atlantica]
MISPKKLVELAKKWQKLAATKQKRVSSPSTSGVIEAESCRTCSMTEKGHVVVYTNDQKCFVIPLNFLKNNIIIELFTMAEDEFRLPVNGPITLPCDAVFMECAISLILRNAAKDVDKALLMSLATCLPSSNLHQNQSNQQSLICNF